MTPLHQYGIVVLYFFFGRWVVFRLTLDVILIGCVYLTVRTAFRTRLVIRNTLNIEVELA